MVLAHLLWLDPLDQYPVGKRSECSDALECGRLRRCTKPEESARGLIDGDGMYDHTIAIDGLESV